MLGLWTCTVHAPVFWQTRPAPCMDLLPLQTIYIYIYIRVYIYIHTCTQMHIYTEIGLLHAAQLVTMEMCMMYTLQGLCISDGALQHVVSVHCLNCKYIYIYIYILCNLISLAVYKLTPASVTICIPTWRWMSGKML